MNFAYHDLCELRFNGVSRKFALRADLLLDHRLGRLGRGYGVRVPMHYLPGPILRSIDHRNLEKAKLDHDDARPPQVGANGVRPQILPR